MADLEKFPCWQIQKFVSQISYIVVVCEMIGADSGSPEKSRAIKKNRLGHGRSHNVPSKFICGPFENLSRASFIL